MLNSIAVTTMAIMPSLNASRRVLFIGIMQHDGSAAEIGRNYRTVGPHSASVWLLKPI